LVEFVKKFVICAKIFVGALHYHVYIIFLASPQKK